MANTRQPVEFSLAGLRLLNTSLPRFVLPWSPWKNRNERHWKNQGSGDPHGCQNYNFPTERLDILLQEVRLRGGVRPLHSKSWLQLWVFPLVTEKRGISLPFRRQGGAWKPTASQQFGTSYPLIATRSQKYSAQLGIATM
jgi:hypothetical protein